MIVDQQKMDAFIKALQEKNDARMAASYPNLTPPKYEANWMKRYIRIETVEAHGGRSAFCFIDPSNGDILKSASWKAPAKHARGNIHTPTHGVEHLGPYGAQYLR